MRTVNKILFLLIALLFAASLIGILMRRISSSPPVSSVHTSEKPDEEGSPVIITAFAFKGVKIVIEPENCITVTPPVTVIQDSTASGHRCIEIKEGAGKPPHVYGKAVCRFTVPKSADYRLWGRRWWMNACGNSFTFSIAGDHPIYLLNGKGQKKSASIPHTFGEDPSYNPDLGLAWKWTKGARYRFKKGTYTLTIMNREDGVKLDQILLAEEIEDTSFVPEGAEKPHMPDSRP